MPLIEGSSKNSFKRNIRSEMKSGKPSDQAVAIAYSVKQKAKAKKMAEGGTVEDDLESEILEPNKSMHAINELDAKKSMMSHIARQVMEKKSKMAPIPSDDSYADGGEVMEEQSESGDDFLSDEAQTPLNAQHYPEDEEHEVDGMHKGKMRLSSILASIKSRHMRG